MCWVASCYLAAEGRGLDNFLSLENIINILNFPRHFRHAGLSCTATMERQPLQAFISKSSFPCSCHKYGGGCRRYINYLIQTQHPLSMLGPPNAGACSPLDELYQDCRKLNLFNYFFQAHIFLLLFDFFEMI